MPFFSKYVLRMSSYNKKMGIMKKRNLFMWKPIVYKQFDFF